MILNPPGAKYRKQGVIQKKNAFSCRKMSFPAEKCTFLQKGNKAFPKEKWESCRKMPFPAETCLFLQKNAVLGGDTARNRRKSQEGFRARESRTLANFTRTFHRDERYKQWCWARTCINPEGLTDDDECQILAQLATVFQLRKQRNGRTVSAELFYKRCPRHVHM